MITNIERESIIRNFVHSFRKLHNEDIDKMKHDLEVTKKDWIAAQLYFDMVDEPELVDFAIYNQKACEEKYAYLIRKAKKLNIINQ